MIEDWNFTLSYDSYWQACAPASCTYFDKIHTKDLIGIVITLISMIGGLVTGLHMLARCMVGFLYFIFRRKNRRHQEGIERQKFLQSNR